MTFSKSGKVQYLCGRCKSKNVVGPIEIRGQTSLVCGDCLQYMPWTSRIKVSTQPEKQRSTL